MTNIDRGQVASRPGQVLPNHTTILDMHWYHSTLDDMVGFVLAVAQFSPDPYVTWERHVYVTTTASGQPQQVDITYHGHYHRDLYSALKDFTDRVDTKDEDVRNTRAMKLRGHEDGKAAASWLVDGNTPDPYKVLEDYVKGMDDGDPAVLDQLPVPRVGGEFADDDDWEEICLQEIERYVDGEDALYAVYTEAFHDGVEEGIREMHSHFKEALGA